MHGRSWRGDCPACGYAGAFVLDVRDGWPVGWCASCQDRAAIGRLVSGDLPGGWTSPSQKAAAQEEERAQHRRDDAVRLFDGGIAAFGTSAQRHLTRRGLPDMWKLAALRFRADTPHPDRCRRPAMLAIVRDPAGYPCAVHRTYVTLSQARRPTSNRRRPRLVPFVTAQSVLIRQHSKPLSARASRHRQARACCWACPHGLRSAPAILPN